MVGPLVVAMAVFLPTLYFVPHEASAFSLLALLMYGRARLELTDVPMLLAVALASLNLTLSLGNFSEAQHLSSLGVVMWPVMIVASRNVDKRVCRWLVYLTAAEALVVIYQAATGQRAMFASQIAMQLHEASTESAGREDLLYLFRPLGLSATSSVTGQKFFIGVLLLMLVEVRGVIRYFLGAVILAAAILNFNRSALVSIGILFIVLYFRDLVVTKDVRRLALGFLIAAGLAVATTATYQELIKQFTRATGHVEFTGRGALVEAGLERIAESPVRGTGSLSYRTTVWEGLPPYLTGQHLHNSLLMLIVQHGLLIGGLMAAFVAMRLNWYNWPYVLAILVYSMGQYGIFWGVSYVDIVFYFLLGLGASRQQTARLQPRSGDDPGHASRSVL